MHRFVDELVLFTTGDGEEPVSHWSGYHRGVVLVGTKHALGGIVVGVADHAEQAEFLIFTINGPVRVENLVATMLGVRLGEHHQLRIGWVTTQGGETLYQIVDFIISKGQAQFAVGRFQRVAATTDHIHRSQLAGGVMREQGLGVFQLCQHHFHHAIVQG